MSRSSLIALLSLAACSATKITLDPTGADSDAGTSDSHDTGTLIDSGATDSGGTDSGTQDSATSDSGTTDTQPDWSMYDGASLVVAEPRSATIYRLVDGLPFRAKLVDAHGQTLPFSNIEWRVLNSQIAPFTTTNALVVPPTLEPGIYAIDVEADLPNGDHLKTSLSQVRVQTRLSGVWVGTVHLTASTTIQNTPIQADCIGAISFDVPVEGDTMQGDGGCMLVLGALGQLNFDVTIDASIQDPVATGDVSVGVSLAQVPMSLDNSGFHGGSSPEFQGHFDGDILGIQLSGELTANIATRWVSP